MTPRRAAVAAFLAAMAGVAAGCSDPSPASVEGAAVERTSTTATPSTTAPPTTTTTTAPPVELIPPQTAVRPIERLPVRDWKDESFDFGQIREATVTPSGRRIAFDRMQVLSPDGKWVSGIGLWEEPVVVGNSPDAVRNVTYGVRYYSVSSDVRVLRLSPSWRCGPDGPIRPAWDDISFDDLVRDGVGVNTQNSLVFSANVVVQIRLSRPC